MFTCRSLLRTVLPDNEKRETVGLLTVAALLAVTYAVFADRIRKYLCAVVVVSLDDKIVVPLEDATAVDLVPDIVRYLVVTKASARAAT